ncbi:MULTISPECIES: ABC transporter ATP-binding protein [unclassified Streptococcus]|uniref:ABC transporter ATP-binding protein n=1 Tax=unclassified Streptococcus TaxID=2608887 RepID=UPI0010723902|nr:MULTISPECIES: ABC transporter ATP-binding protein [unclassified Streptococcus]MBF0806507.1 ABC transporter ATP-binding protein [Streptococcus sp. 19428wA2_WM07]TFU27847.1 ABC transporter ATP-binding protein [Streptococcus sp. WM07]
MIHVEKLVKEMKGKRIVDNMSFDIVSGESVAIIGPNGAGKTSLMNCLTGKWKASAGLVTVSGEAPWTKDSKGTWTVLGQENVIPLDLKVKELVAFFQDIFPDSLSDEELDRLLQFSQEQKNQLTQKLSGGQRRFLAFVLCLVGKPRVLFLDEPTAGMDTSTRKRFWEIVEELKAQGLTIFYSSHYIEEVEYTADRILMIHNGKLLRDTRPELMRIEEQVKVVTLARNWMEILSPHLYYELEDKGEYVHFKTQNIEEVWEELSIQGCRISDIEIQNKSLLDILFEQTEEEK